MSTRHPRWAVPIVVLLLMACAPTNALAFIGIFERLSGPGPFFPSFQFPLDRLVCVSKTGQESHIFGRDEGLKCATDDPDIRLYVSVEINQGRSEANDKFPAVSLTGLKPIVFFRLPKATFIDLGAGLGTNRFSGKGLPGTALSDTSFGFTRWSVPLRARIFFVPERKSRKYRAVHLAVQFDYFMSDFDSDDFESPPGYQSKGRDRWVPSVYLSVDVLRLIR